MKVAESLFRKNKGTHKQLLLRSTVRSVVISCMHSITHNFKKVADRYDVPVVSLAPNELLRLCRKINSSADAADKCKTKHPEKFADSTPGVVYEIPTSCGCVYMGQTCQCFKHCAHVAALEKYTQKKKRMYSLYLAHTRLHLEENWFRVF